MEVEYMAVNVVEQKKTLEYYNTEVGFRYHLDDPELIFMILNTGYIILDSTKILYEKRPDKKGKKKVQGILTEIQDYFSSEELEELERDEELIETIQTSFDEQD